MATDHNPSDEISLIDLCLVLARRKLIVLGCLAICVALALAYLFWTAPVYESRAVVAIGQTPDGPIESATNIAQRLKAQYRIGESGRELPYIASVDAQGNTIVLTAQATGAEEARTKLDQAVRSLVQEHAPELELVRGELEARAAWIETRIDQSRRLARLIEERLEAAPLGEYAAIDGMLMLERVRLLTDVPSLERERSELLVQMSDLQLRPTQAIREPSLPEDPIRPRPALVLALSVVLGLMLGVGAAFLAEFAASVRQQTRSIAPEAPKPAAVGTKRAANR